MKRYRLLLAAVVLLAGATGLAAADGGPLADAGLDQAVEVNTTVQLDGTGSTHPNGTIDRFEWSIETPRGRTISPNCPACARTRFTPHEAGRYEVTLTVTDTQGRSDSDTLYVDVEHAGPTVDLTGPTAPRVHESVTYTATATSSDADLRRLTWTVDNRTVSREPMTGTRDNSTRPLEFDSTDPIRIVVVVRDARNRTARDTLLVEPRGRPNRSSETEARERNAPTTNDSTSTDRNTTCTEAATIGGDYVCVATGDDGGTDVTRTPGQFSENCQGTDLSTCDPQRSPSEGTGSNDGGTGGKSGGGNIPGGNDATPDRDKESSGSYAPGFVV